MLYGEEKRRIFDLPALVCDLVLDHLGNFLSLIVHIADLKVDQLDAVGAVGEALQGTFQFLPVSLGLFEQAVRPVDVVVKDRRILGEGPEIILPLFEVTSAQFTCLVARRVEPHRCKNHHGNDD